MVAITALPRCPNTALRTASHCNSAWNRLYCWGNQSDGCMNRRSPMVGNQRRLGIFFLFPMRLRRMLRWKAASRLEHQLGQHTSRLEHYGRAPRFSPPKIQ